MLNLTHADWQAHTAALRFRDQAFIGEKFVGAARGAAFDCINPATDKVLGKVAASDSENMDRAVNAARQSFEAGNWARAAPGDRKAVLLRLAELIRENLAEMALLDSLDKDKLVTDGLATSVRTENFSRAHRVADALHVGTISIINVDALSAQTPFGGMKQSGFDCDLSLHSMDKYIALKTIWIKYQAR